MKKLMLLLVTAFIVAGTQAQTKEEIEKRKAAKEEQAKLTSDQAAIDKEQAVLAEQARQEKIKMFKETRAQWVKDSLRSIQDSSNKVQTENDRLSTEKYLAVDKSRNDVYTAAGLSDYEMQKVKVINSQYYARAKAINADESIAGDIKSKRLAALNKERLKKIKATLGGKKASALEKARKTTAQNAEDSDSQWLYEIDSTKGKKKS